LNQHAHAHSNFGILKIRAFSIQAKVHQSGFIVFYTLSRKGLKKRQARDLSQPKLQRKAESKKYGNYRIPNAGSISLASFSLIVIITAVNESSVITLFEVIQI